jgi:hypothetical protein
VTDGAQPPRCLVLCAHAPGDPRAPNIRAIADANVAVLPDSVRVGPPHLTRDALPALIPAHQPPGIVFCGHGRADGNALLLGDTALWDADNLDVCAGRWFHAIACHSAPALGQEAIARGVTAFVGYNGLVWAYWQTDAIPLEAQPIVTQILSVVSKHLHQGVHDEQVLRRVIRKAFDAWVRWKNANHRGLRRMKTTFDSQAIDQLLRSLCMGLRLHIRGPAV